MIRPVLRTVPFVLLLAAGCGSQPAATALGPAPVLVVTVDGQPAAGLSVRLVSDVVSGGGVTDAAGRLAARGPDDKALPSGVYKVTVTDAGDKEANPMEPVKKGKSRVPTAYAKPASTPLSVTIEAGKSEYPMDVKSKP